MMNRIRKALGMMCAVVLLICTAVSLAEEPADAGIGEAAQEEIIAGMPEDNHTAETADDTSAGIPEDNHTAEAPEDTSAGGQTENGAAPAPEETNEEDNQSPSWLSKLVERLGKTNTEAWIAFGTLVALFFVLRFAIGSASKWNATMVSYGALSIALSFILSYIRLPVSWSGSITPGSMLPVMFFAAAYGVGPGMVAGLVYGLLQFLQKPEFLSAWQFILDYLLAFSALGLAGLTKVLKQKGKLYISIAIASLARMICAILAGVMWAFDSLGQGWELEIELFGSAHIFSPWPYSIVYNALYMIPEMIICMILATVLAKPLMRMMKGKQ